MPVNKLSRVWRQTARESARGINKHNPCASAQYCLNLIWKKINTPEIQDRHRRANRTISQLALQVLVVLQPGLDVLAVTLQPVNLGADGVQALRNGTVVTL